MFFKKKVTYLEWDVYKHKINAIETFAFKQSVRKKNIANL